ncbi:MAG: hypothetical protein KAJ75_06175 [Alphaproteobacteria bacterium]|nr:hypothetical protein [Alphaproteobacteria bacterium]
MGNANKYKRIDTKPWWKSQGVWGGIIAVAAGIGGLFGYSISGADQASIAEAGIGIASAVGGLVAIIGRISASKNIG